jgi:hypothetical protein
MLCVQQTLTWQDTMIRRVRIRAVQNGGMKIGGLSLGKE